MDRAVERSRVAAREVHARGAVVRHEHRVADPCVVLNDIGDAGRRVAGRVHHAGGQAADLERLTVAEAVVELGSVGRKIRRQVVDALPGRLHGGDMLTDGQFGALQPVAQITARRQMIRMDMRLQNPIDRQPLGLHEGANLVRQSRRGAARARLVIEHGIDDRGPAAGRVGHHVGQRRGMFIEDGFDGRSHGRA